MLQNVKVANIKDHPENTYYFDDMNGSKWEDFLESVQERGIIEPPILTQDFIIVGGHQRIHACRELGIEEVLCDVREYANDKEVLRDLIEMNVQQRGEIVCGRIKKARLIKALEDIYGIKHGGSRNGKKTKDDSSGHDDHLKTGNELRDELHIDQRTWTRFKNLLDLIPSLQEKVDNDELPFVVASDIVAKLPADKQEELARMLPERKMSVTETQEYIDLLEESNRLKQENDVLRTSFNNDTRVEELESEIEGLKQDVVDAQRAINSATDSKEYMRMKEKLEEATDAKRKEYERAEKLKQQLIDARINLDKSTSEVNELKNKLKEADEKKNDVVADSKSTSVEVQKDDYPEQVIANLGGFVNVIANHWQHRDCMKACDEDQSKRIAEILGQIESYVKDLKKANKKAA